MIINKLKKLNRAKRINELKYLFSHEDYKDLNINQKITYRSDYIINWINPQNNNTN